MQENKMGVMPVRKLLVSMSVPIMVSMLIQALYNVVDSIFVAQISEDALTAVSLAYPVQSLLIAVSVGTGVGINSLLSRRLGEGKLEEANATANNGVFVALVSSLVFAVLGLVFARPFIAAFTDNQQIVEMGTSYLQICLGFSFGSFIMVATERLSLIHISSVCIPVATTIPAPRPYVTTLLEYAILIRSPRAASASNSTQASFSTGNDSPVSAAS